MNSWYVSVKIAKSIDSARDQQLVFEHTACQSIYANETCTEVVWFLEGKDAEDALLDCLNSFNKVLDSLGFGMEVTHIRAIPEKDREQELLRQTEG